MPLKNYGVLKGRPISSRIGLGRSPHYQIHIVDDTTDYRIAINVKSKLAPSELLYLIKDDFKHPIIDDLKPLSPGFTLLESIAGGRSVDYIRGNFFDAQNIKPLAHYIPGPDNDLNEKIHAYIERAIADEDAEIYAFGERWGPEARKKDKYFGFLPGNGIHDIHMNQGNVGNFVKDDGVWQDGALIIHFPVICDDQGELRWPEQWVALFLAFQSQSWHTDDATGHTLPAPAPGPSPTPLPGDLDAHIRIIAALVNPVGGDPGHETITLINTTPAAVDLTNWVIVDRNKKQSKIASTQLLPGKTMLVELDGKGAQLSNKGGVISLLDAQGVKIHGVSYSREQARKQGWSLIFTD